MDDMIGFGRCCLELGYHSAAYFSDSEIKTDNPERLGDNNVMLSA